MREALFAAFAPTDLSVSDDSALHHGHAGAAPGGETHYSVRIRAAAFAGVSRVQRHRMINDVLADEFKSGLHAMAIDAAAPDA